MFSWLLWIASRNPPIANLYWVLSPGLSLCVKCFPHISSQQPCKGGTIILAEAQRHEITCPKSQSHIRPAPKVQTFAVKKYRFLCVCVHSYPIKNNQWWGTDNIALTWPLVFSFSPPSPPLPPPSSSVLTAFQLFPSFSFPKANTPCETWSIGFQAGITAATQRARPCRMTRWQPCAAPCTRWSPKTWRMPRPYGTLAASRSWSASPKAKETSKSDGDFLSHKIGIGRIGSKCAQHTLGMGNTTGRHWEALVSDNQEKENSRWFPVFPPHKESWSY